MVHMRRAQGMGQHSAHREVYRGMRNCSIQNIIHGINILLDQHQAIEDRKLKTYMLSSRSRTTPQDQTPEYNHLTYVITPSFFPLSKQINATM